MKTVLTFSFLNLFTSVILFAQERISSEAKRKDLQLQTTQLITEKVDTQHIWYQEIKPLVRFALPEVTLTNIDVQSISSNLFPANFQFPSSFDPIVQIAMERKKPVAIISIPRYIKNANGQIQLLKNYQLQLNETNTGSNKTTGNRVYAAHSVLATGDWYKISLSKQGLYKIDYNFIKSKLKIIPENINTANIRLYGNGGQMLSESNADLRVDDLVENPIQLQLGSDNQFNEGDYILFYAEGPHTILKDSLNKKFSHIYNLYSETSHYFLNFDKGAGKRIQIINPTGISNVNVNSFNEFVFYEKDSVNLGRFGKRWWGDEFNDIPGRYLNRTFSFSIPDYDPTTPINITTVTGGVSNSGFSSMNITANGQPLQNLQYSPFPNVEEYNKPVIEVMNESTSMLTSANPLTLNFSFAKGSSAAAGFLDYIEINARRNLVFNGYLNFADWNSVGQNKVATYQLQSANANTQIWDITDPLSPIGIQSVLNGNQLNFKQDASTLHRFIAYDGTVFETPAYIEKIENQDLHALSSIDYIIISNPLMKSEAERLALHHQSKRNYRYKVVTPQEIYNEFSSGTQDISALRDFVKMLYDKSSLNDMPKYLLLMGDGSYDYKDRLSNNTNLVPVSETNESISKITGYCTDDFFGFLDDSEDPNIFGGSQINMLDIGVGRLPVNSASQATEVVNKIIRYDSPASFGSWKNTMTFNADDEDYNNHFSDAEDMSKAISDSLPAYNNAKIYVDGFIQQSTPAGPRTPDANKAVNDQLFNGTFLMNYNGHGGPSSWCEERIFTMDDINGLKNRNRLPLFITATCDFAPFDNPAKVSAGENLILNGEGGAIALMTTTQLVYADQNWIMNMNYIKSGFKRLSDGNFPTLGDAYRISKNKRYNSPIDASTAANFRKFALLGDPALPLAFPAHQLFTDSVNGMSVTQYTDTLKALKKYTITGHVADKNGQLLSSFNGVVYPTIFDKPRKLSTLKNDAKSIKAEYFVQNSIIYKGKATVKDGKFSFTFVVPKDINYEIAKGKISYYADNGMEDANGFDTQIYIGGSSGNANTDNAGPVIKPFMNDEKFVNGGITTKNSTLYIKLSDDNGINYTGNSIGHDITAVLDGNSQNTYVLNNFFEAELDDYRSGTVKFPISNLSEGQHSITIKAWDIFNNSAEAKLDFVVVSTAAGKLAQVYNYPNPFTTKTKFMFEHNLPNQNLYVGVNIYTIGGKQVKSIRTMINTPGTRSDSIEWDGLDEFGDKLGKGVYIYKLSIKSQTGYSDSKLQKLVLLR
ncbi:MAG: type IX secretion system sortase PorU [Chitinophagaceae bacterium]|nr:type IX secretion system sortase PorU [Chitinophagaceae bacterium]